MHLYDNTDNKIVTSSKMLCSKWIVSTKPKNHRRVFVKKHFDDINHINEDRILDITEYNFRVTMFLLMLLILGLIGN